MSTAHITIPRLGSTRSSAAGGGPGAGAAVGEVLMATTETYLSQLLRIAVRIVAVQRWAGRHGGSSRSSAGNAARR